MKIKMVFYKLKFFFSFSMLFTRILLQVVTQMQNLLVFLLSNIYAAKLYG